MNLIERSLKIALKSHTGQTDRAGEPYVLHPLRLMSRMESDHERAVALLHDVIEDSCCTAEDLLEQGIPEEVITAVLHLTQKEAESYEQYIKRCSENELATTVKIADIEDNINPLRLHKLDQTDLNRIAKYHKAWRYIHPITKEM